MATVFAPPASIPAPDFSDFIVEGRYDREADKQATGKYLAALRTWLKDHGYKHRLTGKLVAFPVADGCAQYMIINGTRIMYLPLGDAWQIPDAHARGLRATDLAALAR
jgi:hypothetical protein